MKRSLLRLLFLLPFLACQPATDSSSPPTETSTNTPLPLPEGQLIFETTTANAFSAAKGDSLQKLLIQQFCDESKGYRANVWLGLNKCSWAIEKYWLDQNPDIIQRNGDELNITLPNGEKMSFIHDLREADQAAYYQFKCYLPQNDFLFIEKIVDKQCPQHLLVNRQSGQQIELNGVPFLAPSGDAFLLQSHQEACRTKLEHWSLQGQQSKRNWAIGKTDWDIKEVKWTSPQEWLIALANQNEEHSKAQFAKVKWVME